MSGKTAFILIALLLLLAMATIGYAGIEQARLAAIRAEAGSVLAQAPEAVRMAEATMEWLLIRALGAAIFSLFVAIGIVIWQWMKIAEMRGQGWERFWARRRVRAPKRPKQPSLQEILMAALIRDLTKDK